MDAGLGQRCGACGKPLAHPPHQVDTRDGQVVYVGPECARHIARAGSKGWKPPVGGPKLYPIREMALADVMIGVRLRHPGRSLTEMLMEGRLEVIAQQHANVSTDHDPIARHRDPQSIVQHFADHDPTHNKQYTGRVMQWYAKGHLRQEDAPRVHRALELFHRNRSQLPEKDINRYPTLTHLEDAVAPFEKRVETPWVKSTQAQRDTVEKGSTLLHDSPELAVREVHTHGAMKVLGSGTKWCVVPDESVFNDYHETGKFYHLHDKETGRRVLAHFETGQVMSEHDRPVDTRKLEKKHPVLRQLFHNKSYEHFNDPKRIEHEIATLPNYGGYPPFIRNHVASITSNQDTLHALRDDSAKTNEEWGRPIQLHVAMNKHTRADTLEHIMANPVHNMPGGADTAMRHVLGHPNVPHSTLRKAYWDGAPYGTAHQAIASNPGAPPDLLRLLAQQHVTRPTSSEASGQQSVIHALTRNPATPHDVMHKWIFDEHKELPKWAPTLDQPLRRSLTTHATLLAFNPSATAEMLGEIHRRTRTEETHVHHSVARHRNTDAATLDSIERRMRHEPGDPSSSVREAVAEHPNASAETLLSLTHTRAGRSRRLASAIARNKNTPHEALKHLWTVGLNRGVPPRELRVIAKHQNADPTWSQKLEQEFPAKPTSRKK